MTHSRAQQYGVATLTDVAFFIRGRGLLWSVQQHGNVAGTTFDNITAGGRILGRFYIDPTNTKATGTMHYYPQGMPFEIGIYISGGVPATITYTGLTEIFFTL